MPSRNTENAAHDSEQHVEFGVALRSRLEGVFAGCSLAFGRSAGPTSEGRSWVKAWSGSQGRAGDEGGHGGCNWSQLGVGVLRGCKRWVSMSELVRGSPSVTAASGRPCAATSAITCMRPFRRNNSACPPLATSRPRSPSVPSLIDSRSFLRKLPLPPAPPAPRLP